MLQWTQSLQDQCPKIIYKFYRLDGVHIIAIKNIEFDNQANILSFKINTQKIPFENQSLIIKGYVNDIFAESLLTVHLTDKCREVTFNKPKLSEHYIYELGSPQIEISHTNWTFSEDLKFCGSVFYSIIDQDEQNIDPEIITIDLNNEKILISTFNETKVGMYYISIKGQLKPSGFSKSYDFLNFTLLIKLPTAFTVGASCDYAILKYIPQIPPLNYEIGKSGQVKSFKFAKWTTNETKCEFQSYQAFYNGNLLPIPSIISFSESSRMFSLMTQEIEENQPSGNYELTVVGQLPNGIKYSTKFSFKITSSNQENLETQQQLKNELAIQKEVDSTFFVSKDFFKINNRIIKRDSIKSNLNCTISKIDMLGKVTLKFSKDIIEYSQFSKLKITNALVIKFIQFGDDLRSLSDYDQLSVQFKVQYFFVTEDLTQMIEKDAIIYSKVPPQLPNTQQVGSTMTGTVSFNFALTMLMGFSLNNLWMLLNTLQIMVHLPMLGISIPSNAINMFQNLIGISNMNLIPTAYIKKYILTFVKESNSDVKGNFATMDIF
ncbi:UNKNOWN [Stylonychia lemnae]|uniref:Uncharacterized protein n=1 Tax=Stylonychia lemnae TaxID=5949 RepID=A0A078AGF9_STYLE|nr:UNKNOWN [Stylonychia lemnae]|eukprot:CDW80627.1 UNKNOWN [Stylonychia lemnae]